MSSGPGWLTVDSLMPLMCFAYFLQFLDKMVLSQTTLFGLLQDLVSIPRLMSCFSN